MAVQARHLPHDFPPVGGFPFVDEYAGCVPTPAPPARITTDTTLLCDLPGSELTSNCGLFVPRKRARVGSFVDSEDQRVGVALSTPAAMHTLLLPLPLAVGDARSRTVASGAASTSGRAANGATLPFSQLGGEIDALIRYESERMRVGLEDARRRHARALLAAAARASAVRLRAAEAEVERALRRNAELEEKARQAAAECQAWAGVAGSHEAVAAGLRATLDRQLLLRSLSSPTSGASAEAAAAGGGGDAAGGGAEDARSCCFEAPGGDDGGTAAARWTCRSCGGGEACVLLLPCRHLCLCRACEGGVDACPVCAAAKNASLLVLVS